MRLLILQYTDQDIPYKLIANLSKIPYNSPLRNYLAELVGKGWRTCSLRASEIQSPKVVLKEVRPLHFKFNPEWKTHEDVEYGLVSDPNTNFLVAELPVWVGNVISGHIDLVEKVGEIWWIWDYKSDDVKSLPSYAQVWLYRKMFAYRLGLKEEEIRMGYFNRECEVEVEEVPDRKA